MNKNSNSSKRAKESSFVARTRKKLEKRLKEIDQKITPQALQEVTNNIHRWIRRHEPEREKIKGTVSIFDENVHSAPVYSEFVKNRLFELRGEIDRERKGDLRGRIKTSTTL